MIERSNRIADAMEQFQQAEQEWKDANNEVELYKELMASVDPGAGEAEKAMFDEYEQEMMNAQMRIADLENYYEEVKYQYESMNREKERTDGELADYQANKELNEQTEAAENAMEEAKVALESINIDLNSLQDRLGKAKKQSTKDEISTEIEMLITERTTFEQQLSDAQGAFNALAEAKMAVELAREDREIEFQKQEAFDAAKREIETYERKMNDLENRLKDFERFASG
jgi:chromosome segregation ATPase